MSSRFQMVAILGVFLASLSGASHSSESVESRECTNVQGMKRHGGPPGKSVRLPKRSRTVETCVAQVEEKKPLVLVSFTDARGGVALERGHTERAAEVLGKRLPYGTAEELTNLCVARTALRQLDSALEVCDSAVAAAMRERARTTRVGGMTLRQSKELLAVAYSNRAVLNWLRDDGAAAHNDLAKAQAFAPVASYVTNNLEVTHNFPSLARTPDIRIRVG